MYFSAIEMLHDIALYKLSRPVDGTSMNEECEAVKLFDLKLQPRVDRQVCAVKFLT